MEVQDGLSRRQMYERSCFPEHEEHFSLHTFVFLRGRPGPPWPLQEADLRHGPFRRAPRPHAPYHRASVVLLLFRMAAPSEILYTTRIPTHIRLHAQPHGVQSCSLLHTQCERVVIFNWTKVVPCTVYFYKAVLYVVQCTVCAREAAQCTVCLGTEVPRTVCRILSDTGYVVGTVPLLHVGGRYAPPHNSMCLLSGAGDPPPRKQKGFTSPSVPTLLSSGIG